MSTLDASRGLEVSPATGEWERSSYRDRPHFERVITGVAEHLARGRCFRWEREGLAVAGTYLAVISLLSLAAPLFPRAVQPFGPATWLIAAWVIFGTWGAWYLRRVTTLAERIVQQRLCFCCGSDLREEPVDERGRGFCHDCGRPYNIADYAPPPDCIAALRRAHETMVERCPPAPDPPPPPTGEPYPVILPTSPIYLYRCRGHYETVMRGAALRVLSQRGLGVTLGFVLVMTATALGGTLAIVGMRLPVILVIPVLMLVVVGVVTWEMARISKEARRIGRERLCIGCGYPTKSLALDEYGRGDCPECGRHFHEREYLPPPMTYHNSSWRASRAQAMIEPRPLAPPTVPSGCVTCGYQLRGLPINESGQGICPECGHAFSAGMR